MAKKPQNIKPKPTLIVPPVNSTKQEQEPPAIQLSLKEKLVPYLPGILLFLIALIIGIIVNKDYGISWDESVQRDLGIINYDYIFHGKQTLLTYRDRNYGAVFELLLIGIEKTLKITDLPHIYQMRHLVTHIFFLVSILSAYFMLMRLFKNNFIACLGFLMLLLAPRMYAHSFFNSKDIPLLSMFLITLSFSQLAFSKNRTWLYVVLGVFCGLTTGIRVMAVMLFLFIALFLVIDILTADKNGGKQKKAVLNLLLFSGTFCLSVYICWPFLWASPVTNFIGAFTNFSRFAVWDGNCLLAGEKYHGLDLPWTYFPTWFLISNPILWLVAGFAGLWVIIKDFLKKPMSFIKNTSDRNFLLYVLCFTAPIAAIFILHSILYDDWRHLYFIYPSFIFIGLYFINKILLAVQDKYRVIVKSVCLLQVLLISYFMVSAHPFQEVYFNELVSHKHQSLRDNYDLDYWGCSYKQGLQHLLAIDKSDSIKVSSAYTYELNYCGEALMDNIKMLDENDRKRLKFSDYSDADYFITIFLNHNEDYPIPHIVYSIDVLNSSILCVYKIDRDESLKMAKKYAAAQKNDSAIIYFNKVQAPAGAANSDSYVEAQISMARVYFGLSRLDSAEVHLKGILAIKPNYEDALTGLGVVYTKTRKYADAIAQYNRLIAMRPKNSLAFSNMGYAYFNMKQYEQAILCFQKSIEIDPVVHVNDVPYLATSWKIVGNIDSAHKYEAIAQKSNPAFKL